MMAANRPGGLFRKALLALLLSTSGSLAQIGGSYSLEWFTVDGGGASSVNGPYALHGTIGQPDAGVLAGGQYQLIGGVWGAAFSQPDLTGAIQITASGMNVILSWSSALVRAQLEQTSSLGLEPWTPVQAAPVRDGDLLRIVLPINAQNQFYRLRILGP